jgi:hypothetical protein
VDVWQRHSQLIKSRGSSGGCPIRSDLPPTKSLTRCVEIDAIRAKIIAMAARNWVEDLERMGDPHLQRWRARPPEPGEALHKLFRSAHPFTTNGRVSVAVVACSGQLT